MQLAMGNILATIHMPVGIKTLLLIKYLRRNLVPLLHWPYTAQGSETCYPQEVLHVHHVMQYDEQKDIRYTQSTLPGSC